jgi:ribose/xylose/arabinose/galactoside ABC-type transport system permease subunit
MALVFNAFIFFKMDVLWNRIAIGIILILAVVIDENIQRERTVMLKT